MDKTTHTPLFIDVSRLVGRAVADYDLIKAGDRIAVAVSGGKDSICLMHLLRHRQQLSPQKFEFAAVHVDFDFEDFNPAKLIEYLDANGFAHHIEKVDSLKGERWEDIDCFWWSKNRRKALFVFAQRMGFNKIALGHHMDDIVETILLNQFYRAEISTMRPSQELFDGLITLIRPLAYAREKDMVTLAQELGIESIGGQSKCSNDDTSNRMLIKKMLQEFDAKNPYIVKNIFRSLRNIEKDYLLDLPTGRQVRQRNDQP